MEYSLVDSIDGQNQSVDLVNISFRFLSTLLVSSKCASSRQPRSVAAMLRYTYRFAVLAGLLATGPTFAQSLPTPIYGDVASTTTQLYFVETGGNGSNGWNTEFYQYWYGPTPYRGSCDPATAGGSGSTPSSIQQISIAENQTTYTGIAVAISKGGNGGSGGSTFEILCHNSGQRAKDGGSGAPGGFVSLTLELEELETSETGTTVAGDSFVEVPGTLLFMQSIGGNGGRGGSNCGDEAQGSCVNVVGRNGGNGGVGGAGGDVSVINYVGAQTTESGGYGIWAVSAGGWGGSGGDSSGYIYPTDGNGDFGSVGSAGGFVSVSNYAQIITPLSIPIFAQSIGGYGGNGGSGTTSWAGVGGGSGGSGGYGGPGGAVSVINSGNLNSSMEGGFGIFAQSVGGGGGAAGAGAGLNAIGASGGYAAASSQVTVENLGSTYITLAGASSIGLYAQSVGGGGGNGGLATGITAIGGSGGDGGNGATVYAMNLGSIFTGGSCTAVNSDGSCDQTDTTAATYDTNGGAFGVLAQSVGGGGGNGGMGLSATVGLPSIVIGGSAGGGGSGGDVFGVHNDTIMTVEPNSTGFLAQSVGGGGGSGGGAIDMTASFFVAMGASGGGDGGYGGNGGVVALNCLSVSVASACTDAGDFIARAPSPVAQVATSGVSSPGLMAQSIGGGGGNGGFAITASAAEGATLTATFGATGGEGGNGQDVYAAVAGVPILTMGSDSPGLVAASIGGGGGHGGNAISGSVTGDFLLSLALGGSSGGSSGGSGGGVSAMNTNEDAWNGAPIVTSGARSYGILAQSIGGGGGGGGNSMSAMVSGGVTLGLTVGGTGGSGQVGGSASIYNDGAISTSGSAASALVVQSIGGGGGKGGYSVSSGAAMVMSVSAAIGGSGGSGATGGAITVQNTGALTTTGHQSIGILAQSIGGGGGSGGSSATSSTAGAGGIAAVTLGVGGRGASGGSSGTTDNTEIVNVVTSGRILTSGINSHGIYAQSVGGGGGNGGSSSASSSVAVAASSDPASASTGGSGATSTSGSSNSSTAGNTQSGQSSSQAGADSGTAVGLSAGGYGGSGGFGNNVKVTNTGTIVTGYDSSSQTAQSNAALGLADNSMAIFAQSVGGGGGNAGSGSSNADGSATSVSLAMGGIGGTGGDAGKVTVNNSGQLLTYGNQSHTIFAQSVGGGGGNGGASSVTAGSGGTYAAAFGLGGSDGAAGNASSVSVTNNAQSVEIVTVGIQSYGVFAQSVGGGGGSGGSVSSAATAASSSSSDSNSSQTGSGQTSSTAASGVSVAAGLGGSGGAGGSGAKVEVTTAAPIYTYGASSVGIFAQSVGGGGGTSGASSTNSNGGAYSVSFALGADGGAGGAGGEVKVGSTAGIYTTGANSIGMMAQSVGGGGGNAGSVSSTSSDSGGEASVSMALGSNAGSGNNGGLVTVTQSAAVSTGGTHATGIMAQSIGGGGGNATSSQSSSSGGKASAALALGGSGGSGGLGEEVEVFAIASIATQGDHASAIMAQSIGGGGGNGASASSTSGNGGDVNTNLSIGGAGSGGGAGGDVFVSTYYQYYIEATGVKVSAPQNQTVTTGGHLSPALVAQSIGGGGGNGGTSASSFNSSSKNSNTTSVGLALGGSSVSGGAAGEVEIYSALPVATAGIGSHAVFAQSVGGGGGSGGSATANPSGGTSTFNLALGATGGSGGAGQAVAVTTDSSLSTTGANAVGLLAQSVGGGGGVGGASNNNTFGPASSVVSHLLGAAGGSAGLSGSVGVDVNAAISTAGANAPAVVAQSVSGGGGFSQSNLNQASSVQYTVSLGGSASAASTASTSNNVQVASVANITTTGVNAIGVVGQSVGAGGGIALTTIDSTSVTLSVSRLGSQSASVGNALPVTVNQSGAVNTSGAGAIGVFAQSVGGGGGYAALVNKSSASASDPGFMTIGSTGSSSGDGGDVTVTVGGSVTTTGRNAIGVFAQSVGGGGGAFVSVGLGELTPGFSAGDGDGGDVTVNINAPVAVSGTGSIGVLAQSVGGGGGLLRSDENFVAGSGQGSGAAGVVAINVNASVTVTGGTAIYAGSVKGDNDPYIYIGPRAVVSSDGGTAIIFDGALNQLVNYGSVLVADPVNDRVVDILQSGQTTIVNYGLLTGQIINRSELTFINAPGGTMGAGSALNNFGTLLVGERSVADTLDLPAALRNDATGTIVFDVDAQNSTLPNDRINVRDAATINGMITTNVVSLLPLDYLFVTAAALTSDAMIQDTLLFDWGTAIQGNTLYGTVDADFAPDGGHLTDMQGSKADYLQRVWDAGGANMAPVFGYLHQIGAGDLTQYQGVLQQVVGGVLNSQAIEFKTNFNASLTDSLSCPIVTNDGLRLEQTSCAWGKLTGQIAEQSANDANSGYHVTSGGIRLGGQKAIDSQWTTGFSLGYGNNYLTSTGLTSNGQFFDLSASLQKKFDAWTFGASLGFAQGWLQNNRSLSLPSEGPAQSLSGLYTSSSRMTMVGLKLRAAYKHDRGNYYVKPYVDLDLAYAHQSGYSESGGLLALKAQSGNQFNVAVTPMLELGTDLATDGDRRIKGYVRVGASFLPDNNVTTQMSLANLSADVGTYGVTTEGTAVLGRMEIGIQAFESDNLEVRAQYGLQAGDGYWSQSLSANLIWRF